MTSILYGILGGSVILYMSLTCREKDPAPEEPRPALFKALKDLLTNAKFWVAGLANAFYSAGMSLVLVAMPFFTKYSLRISEGQTTFLFAAVLLIAIACVALWAWLVRKYTLMPVWRGALLTLAVTFVPLFFANSLATGILCAGLVGFGFAGAITTMDLVGARVMDEDTQKHGLRREGIIANALGFMNRLNGLFTSAAFLLVGKVYGFESGDNPGLHPDAAARFLLTVFPPILMLISFGFSWFINFKKPAEPAPEAAGD
jgi:GPH family glycoside/pentoside/hexuronide:cation symporter